MKVVVTVPPGFLNDINGLVKEGKYSGVDEFLEVAIFNQLNLEKEPITGNPILDPEKQSEPINDVTVEKDRTYSKVKKSIVLKTSQLVELSSNYDDVVIIEPPDEDKVTSGILWGQYNKIFPIKLTTRILANLLKENNEISLNEFKEIASDAARRLGISILDIDKSKRRKKGERLSTALPMGDDPYKSMTRFKNHFIGDVDRKGMLFGAPFKLKFINVVERKIGITKYGLSFAQLRNPLLDDNIKSNNSLSKDEIIFYIDHIFKNIIEESNGMLDILEGVKYGNNDPEKLTRYILSKNDRLQESEGSITRTGLVSRMIELELITSTRIGMRQIEYVLTPSGMELLKNKRGK
jgi:hypothetical protein